MVKLENVPFEWDNNFTYIYANNRIYTIARNTGRWASRGVGELTGSGQLITQEAFNKLAERCSEKGNFTLD